MVYKQEKEQSAALNHGTWHQRAATNSLYVWLHKM